MAQAGRTPNELPDDFALITSNHRSRGTAHSTVVYADARGCHNCICSLPPCPSPAASTNQLAALVEERVSGLSEAHANNISYCVSNR